MDTVTYLCQGSSEMSRLVVDKQMNIPMFVCIQEG